MAWLYLVIAGCCEVGWAINLRTSEGFTKFWPDLYTIIFMISAVLFLSLSLKSIPIGTAYAVWTGIGTIGTMAVGIIFLHEPSNLLRILCILLILAGVTGLRLLSPH